MLVTGSDFIDRFFEVYNDENALDTIGALSRVFGEVQYFATYRVCGADGWAKWQNGNLVRLCASYDDGCLNQGMIDEFETVNIAPSAWDEDPDFFSIGEDKVMSVAKAWSVAPAEIYEKRDKWNLAGTRLLTGWIPKYQMRS